MSNLRQQRAVRNRRLTTGNAPQQVPQIALAIVGHTLNQLMLSAALISQPPTATPTPYPIVLSGVPKLYSVTNNNYPTAATISEDGLTLTLTYPVSPLSDTDTYILGPYDPAIRTAQGGYAAPATLAAQNPPAVLVGYTAVLIDDHNILVTVAPPPSGFRNIVDPTQFLAVEGGSHAAAVAWDGTAYTLTFTPGIGAGEHMSYDVPATSGNGTSWSQPTSANVTITA